MPSDRASTPESTEPAKNPPRVFLSYSHDSEEHLERVLDLANQLRDDDVDAWIDQYELAPEKGWSLWMQRQIERADFVLCVCTETYRRRFDNEEETGRGRGVTWEGALARTHLYLGRSNARFLPLLLDPEDAEHIPTPLADFSRFVPWTAKGYDTLYQVLTGQPRVTAPPLGQRRDLVPQARRSLFGKTVAEAATETKPLAGYRAWAEGKYAHLELIGIDAGDVQVQFEEVYVPLRVVCHPALGAEGLGVFRGGRGGLDMEHEAIEVETVFRRGETRHVLIFGEPGSGKTTALLKLQQLCWVSAQALGLDEDTVPVFLRLRHLSKDLLDEGLVAFLDHEVRERSGGRLTGLGERLWQHGKLLLLLDGLDEIADADHRAEVLRRIGWYLGQDGAERMRAVVSCRRVGLPSRDADREGQLQTYEVRPFDDEQIAKLVTLWFRELARRGKIRQATADRRATTILGALKDRRRSSQQILEMASNPLLLTLLCVVVLLGNEIPKKRVRFYEQCLDVLLDRWPRQRGKPGPVDSDLTREALGYLAFCLHSAKRRDDLSWAEAVAELKSKIGERSLAMELFDWVHGDVGLLVDYTDETYGFVHLGLQEHLTARYLIAHPEELQFLQGDYDASWWTEVFLQIASLSERTGFDALVSQLLEHTDTLERRAGLLRDLLRETHRPELSALIRALNLGSETRRAAILRLLDGVEHRPDELRESLEGLARSADAGIRAQARRLLLSGSRAPDEIVLLFESEEDSSLATELAGRLKGWRGGWLAKTVEGTGRKSGEQLATCSLVVVLLGNRNPKRDGLRPLRTIYDDKPWLVVILPGEPHPTVPEVLGDCAVLAWRLGEEDSLLESIVEHLPEAPAASEPEVANIAKGPGSQRAGLGVESPRAELFTESLTGAVFLPVPGGEFTMGSEMLFSSTEENLLREESREWVIEAPTPTCRVRLSPFWLAQTPVSNEQYGRFLSATGHREPSNWRDRRFSGPDQPVVGVSWEDAVAYCQWLNQANDKGRVFQLPSEAQWEFAARGPESRLYPWGDQLPSDRLACFGLDLYEDKPAAVASFPEGAGPFGHLDLAGLVLEWCRDAWEPSLFRWVREELPLDPLGEADPDLHPLRGGAWSSAAFILRSAFRYRGRADDRHGYVGFRVLCAPPTLGS